MSFSPLEILEEFASHARHEFEESRMIDPAAHEAARQAWLAANGWKRTTPEAKAKAVETTRRWRQEQLKLHPEEYRAKKAAQMRAWRKAKVRS